MPETLDASTAEYEVLTLTLGEEEYGVDILKVQEIRGYEKVTALANAPHYFKGVVNLRGVIVPIIDMRVKLRLGEPSYDALTVVVILNLGQRVVGIVVDRVSDVITLSPEQIKPSPAMSDQTSVEYVVGLGAIEGRMIILVDIDKMVAADNVDIASAVAP